MPQMKYSALDTGGSWRPDAMDQVEQWNAARGDEWSRYALNLMQQNQAQQAQRAAEDWRKEVALKQLGLSEKQWLGSREDTAAERQAAAEARKAQFDLAGRSLGMQEAWNQAQLGRWNREEADRARAMEEAKAKRAAYQQLAGDQSAFSDPSALMSRLATIDPEAAMPMMISRAMRPMERKDTAEEAKLGKALELISSFEGRSDLTPKQKQAYDKAVATASSLGAGAGIGLETRAEDVRSAAQGRVRDIVGKAEELAGGVFGIATAADVEAVRRMQEDLVRELEQQGRSKEEIRSVMRDLNSRLEAVNANDFVHFIY